MVYCDINVYFVSYKFTLCLNKLCAHRVSMQVTGGWGAGAVGWGEQYSALSSSGFGVISSLKMR